MTRLGRIFEIIDHFPTTRVRILVTIVLIVATVVKWLIHACDFRTIQGVCVGWEPSANMIIFLAALAGVDVAQYLSRNMHTAKTVTLPDPVKEKPVVSVEATTDIEEISEHEKG